MKGRNHNLAQKRFALQNNAGGFVLSFAVLIAGVLLSIGLAIFSITLKELILSSGGRESQFAFYAADSGGECALFWDIKHPGYSGSAFAPRSGTGTSTSYADPVPPESELFCNQEDITDPRTGWANDAEVPQDPSRGGWYYEVDREENATTTVFDMAFENGSCATVSVRKTPNRTVINSLGYNSCDLGNPRRVERGLRITY